MLQYKKARGDIERFSHTQAVWNVYINIRLITYVRIIKGGGGIKVICETSVHHSNMTLRGIREALN